MDLVVIMREEVIEDRSTDQVFGCLGTSMLFMECLEWFRQRYRLNVLRVRFLQSS